MTHLRRKVGTSHRWIKSPDESGTRQKKPVGARILTPANNGKFSVIHMPQTSTSDREAPLVFRCRSCGQLMKVSSAAPDPHYINIDLVTWVCDCGQSVDNFIARKEAE